MRRPHAPLLALACAALACGASPANPGAGADGGSAADGGGGSDGGGGGAPCIPACPAGLACSNGVCAWQGDTSKPLRFAVLGDTRPANQWPQYQSSSPYPDAVAAQIFDRVQARAPDFSVFVGDTMYVYPFDYTAAADVLVNHFLPAVHHFTGPTFFVLGNHEAYSGNLQAWMKYVGSNVNYFMFVRTLADGSVAKFIVSSANTYDTSQGAWLARAYAVPSKYTFVFRHYPSSCSDCTASPLPDDLAALTQGHYTLFANGHSHQYKHPATREVTCGNGGAPLVSGAWYGYCLVEQQSNGDILVSARRSDTDTLQDSFTVTP